MKNKRILSYVLITCEEGSNDKEMQVKMEMEGDQELASFLLEQALEKIQHKLSYVD